MHKFRLSCVTACMNRNKRVLKVLPSWLQFDTIQEIIIVDWSSEEPVSKILTFNDERIHVVRVEEQQYWRASEAWNLAFRTCHGRLVLKLDIDYVLKDNFLKIHPLEGGMFYVGEWQNVTENDSHLMGALFVPKRDFLMVNGYNELIKTYGWEDDDLYCRIEKTGLERVKFKDGSIFHIPHDDEFRLKHHEGNIIDRDHETEKNKVIAAENPWSKAYKMAEYETTSKSDNETICRQIPEPTTSKIKRVLL